jgi:hypothetical protein
MSAFRLSGLVLCSLAVLPAQAAEMPPFLAGGQQFATSPGACHSLEEGEGEGLTVRAAGLFGYEFGCNFVAFLPVRDDAGGEPFAWIATASCGDDSGISRPDLFNMTHYDDQLIVTSQNDYVAASSKPWDDQSDPFAIGVIEERFELCR